MRGRFDKCERGQRYERGVLHMRERFNIREKGLKYERKI